LAKYGALSKQDIATAQANKMADAAKVKAAEAALDESEITAPIAGKLGLKLVNLGDYITQGQSLVNLQSIDPLRVDFSIPENYAGNVSVGDKVNLTIAVKNNTNQIFGATVSAVDSAINPMTRMLAVRATVPNPSSDLLPGMFAQATLFAGSGSKLITIPQIAIVYNGNGNYVFKITDNKAVKTPVTILNEKKQEVAVSGLEAGDTVVTEGQLNIHDGTPVHAIH
jgi:membrane fusion protein (multidrug efflux system)